MLKNLTWLNPICELIRLMTCSYTLCLYIAMPYNNQLIFSPISNSFHSCRSYQFVALGSLSWYNDGRWTTICIVESSVDMYELFSFWLHTNVMVWPFRLWIMCSYFRCHRHWVNAYMKPHLLWWLYMQIHVEWNSQIITKIHCDCTCSLKW